MKSFSENRKFWPKTEKYSTEWRDVNIDQIAMYYISMDSSQQALQINGKIFFKFRIFVQKPKFFQKNSEA